jgi:hypothetical protein
VGGLERAHQHSHWSITDIVREAVKAFIRQPQFRPEPGETDGDERQVTLIDRERGRAGARGV